MFKLDNALRNAKNNLLWVMGFTVVNIVLALAGFTVSFPFSLFTPMISAIWSAGALGDGFIIDGLFYLGFFLLIMGLFLWIFLTVDKKPKRLILALIVYVLDTAAMVTIYLAFGDNTWMIDSLFHAWVIVSLGLGYAAARKNAKAMQDIVVQETLTDHERL